jgi:hypothetical protein
VTEKSLEKIPEVGLEQLEHSFMLEGSGALGNTSDTRDEVRFLKTSRAKMLSLQISHTSDSCCDEISSIPKDDI